GSGLPRSCRRQRVREGAVVTNRVNPGSPARGELRAGPNKRGRVCHRGHRGLPDPPAYFAQEVPLNRAGHDAFDPNAAIPEVPAAEAVSRAEGGALLLDVRDDQAFAAGHLRGAVNVGLSGRFAEYAAAVHAPEQAVSLVGNAGEAAEARLRLARVGIDTVVGAVTDFEALIAQPDLTSTQSRLTSRPVAERIATIAELQVVDVRGPGEFAGRTLPGAVNL